jgi:membrane-bound lytic murein transglycosylase D
MPALQATARPQRATPRAPGTRPRAPLAVLLALVVLVAGCAQLQPVQAPAQTEPVAAPVAALAPEPSPPPVATPPAEPPAALEPAPPAPPAPPRGRLDPAQDAERASLWDRIRGGWAMPDFEGDRVGKWEQLSARQPDYVQRMVSRGGRYLFHIVEEVERRQLPAELALLPFIESAFNPQAQSRARASGMWQFMPATGKDFELRQNVFRDDRRDVLASTRAALDYLQRLHGLFGDWHLALAAYNWGQGNVTRAITANRRAGRPTDYASLKMPEETRDYVPKLQAMKNIVVGPQRLGLVLPPLENHPFFLTVPIERDIDVALAARLAGMPLEDFQALNPQMNQPVILAAGVPQVLLPYDQANRFIRELPLYKGPLASWTAWVAPRTLKPAEAARLVGMPEAQLRDVNRIPGGMLVKAGSTLLVPRDAHATEDVAEHVADHATMALTPEGRAQRRLTFKAGRQGETVAAVARRYRVSAAQVGQWNGLPADGRFKPGQTVVVMQAAGPARKAGAAGPSRKRVAPAPQRKAAQTAAPRARKAQAAPR